jgi:hypothetical protein
VFKITHLKKSVKFSDTEACKYNCCAETREVKLVCSKNSEEYVVVFVVVVVVVSYYFYKRVF